MDKQSMQTKYSLASTHQGQQTNTNNRQKLLLKKILEQGLSWQTETLSLKKQAEITAIKKGILADITAHELFVVAQTFVDIQAPIIINGKQKEFRLHTTKRKKYCTIQENIERTSDYESLQGVVMDHIAQCLFGVDSYEALLYV